MRALRDIINDARDGKRLRPSEQKMLGEQLDLYWVDKCDRCRRNTKCDELLDGNCEQCRETKQRTGE